MRKRGKEYFDEADPEEVVDTAWPFDSELKDAKTLQKCEALRQTIKELSVDLGGAARVSPLLADADMQELRHNTRQMLANVHFREYRHTGVYVHHDQDTVLGVDPPTHEEIPFEDASTAPRRFDQAAAKTLDLTDLLLPTDASELTRPGTANYRPNTAFVMMAMDDSKPELKDIETGIMEVFRGVRDRGDHCRRDRARRGDYGTSSVRDRNQRIPPCRPDARTSKRVLRGRSRTRPEQARDSGAHEGYETALRRGPPQLPGIRERRWSERVVAQTVGGDHEQKNSDVTLETRHCLSSTVPLASVRIICALSRRPDRVG